jgi:galactokinase
VTLPAVSLFQSTFGSVPTAAASAPGRVNIIGEHTDYNGGPVLPMAISRRTTVVGTAHTGWEFVSETEGRRVVDIDAPLAHEWTDYLSGVVRELRRIGAAPSGARLAITSTVPIGAGLSSSSALTVAAAAALGTLAGRRLSRHQLIEVTYRAEHDQVGVRGGRMDQTTAALARTGHALLFETGTGEIHPVPFPGRAGIVETGLSHRLAGGALNDRRAECEEALVILQRRWPVLAALAALPVRDLAAAEGMLVPKLRRRVRHVVTETLRTRTAADALGSGNLSEVGRLLVDGHESLRLNYESSVPEADLIVESAVRHGAYGARLMGAGWGGAVLVLGPREHERRILRDVSTDFERAFGRRPSAWYTKASAGVRRDPLRVP